MVYEQEVYNQFAYKKDRPYFHSFPGDVSVSCQQTVDWRTFFHCISIVGIREHISLFLSGLVGMPLLEPQILFDSIK